MFERQDNLICKNFVKLDGVYDLSFSNLEGKWFLFVIYLFFYPLKLYRIADFYLFLSCMTGDYKFMQGTSVFKEF